MNNELLFDMLIIFIISKHFCYTYNDLSRLKVNSEGKFKIVQMTDQTLGWFEPERDDNTTKLMNLVLDLEKPDFVVETGDILFPFKYLYPPMANHSLEYQKEWELRIYDRGIKPVLERSIPYALTLGNHDCEGPLTDKEVVDYDMKQYLSYTQIGPKSISGLTNYILPVYNHNESEIVLYLWFMDSNRNKCNNISSYGCFEDNQIEWYYNESIRLYKLHNNHTIPGFAFFHVPTIEYLYGINGSNLYGIKNTHVSCGQYNHTLIDTMSEIGNIMATFCGHDHENDFYIKYKNMELHYGRRTYYNPQPKVLLDGCKVIEYNLHTNTFTTWIRNEYGEKEIQNLSDVPATDSDTKCFNKYNRRYNNNHKSSSYLIIWKESHLSNLFVIIFTICGTTLGIGIYYLYYYCKEKCAKKHKLIIYRKQSSYVSDVI